MTSLADFAEVERLLQDLAADIREGYKDTLQRNGRKASGTLLDSVSTRVESKGTVYEVLMDLEDYWQYVENDTRPHWPPRNKILEWIRVKPIIPRPDSLGRIPSENQLAFLISRKIAREGTTGSHDLEKTKEAVIPFYQERLERALHHDLYNYITAVLPH